MSNKSQIVPIFAPSNGTDTISLPNDGAKKNVRNEQKNSNRYYLCTIKRNGNTPVRLVQRKMHEMSKKTQIVRIFAM